MRQAVGLLFAAVAFNAAAATIAIDVGHYRARPGATSARGEPEFDYNRTLVLDIARTLQQAGHQVILIGADGEAEDLFARAPQAAGADLMISVHHDSVKPEYMSLWDYEGALLNHSDLFSGFSIFVSRRNPRLAESLTCASALGSALRQSGFTPSRYHADAVTGENREWADEANGVHYFDNLIVLHTASVPAFLFEAGVIVNRDEELKMRDENVRSQIAGGVLQAVGDCLGEGGRSDNNERGK